MQIHHTTLLAASDLRARCIELIKQLTGNEPDDQYLLDVLDLGIDRTDLSDLLADLIDHDVDAEIELGGDDDWEGAFADAISAY